MKKILFVLLSIFVLSGCSSLNTKSVPINGIQEITYEELTQSLNSPVKFLLYIGRPDCSDCNEFYPILEKYINEHEGKGIYYLNIKELRDASRKENATNEEKEFFKNIYKELHFDWTPTIHFISNHQFIDTYQYLDEDYFDIKDENQKEIKKQEYIKEFYKFMDKYA